MKKLILFITLAFALTSSFAQDTKSTVSINAKGDDVRSVIHDLFKQAGKNYVLNPGVRFVLYLSLENVPFEEALDLVCKNASLKFEIKDGIYMVSQYVKPVEPKPEPPKTTPEPKPKVDPPNFETKPRGTMPTSVLSKKVTTRLQKKEIREVMGILAKQTGVAITVSEDVPPFRLDAFLINTSLKYALDEITKATKLKYRFTNDLSIAVEK
jgi:type II secretory pathway component HofQ